MDISKQTQKCRRVHIVDSRPNDYAHIVTALARHKVEVVLFDSATDALRSGLGGCPLLWVLNSRLPDMPATEFCRVLQEHKGATPVILVSDSNSAQHETDARLAGAACYFTKPLKISWLLDAIPCDL